MRILFLGTGSGAGKTTICAMICRHFARKGVNVAPFKASNLSLNSWVTSEGAEIGMGQAFQAWACGIEPLSDMNPVLLKPSRPGVLQLVLHGHPFAEMSHGSPMDTEKVRKEAYGSYDDLVRRFDVVVCEGSGSPAELNLFETDLANTGLMRGRHVPAVIVGDIERGGVFAAIYGTWKLVPEDVRPLLKGFIINRFRGDASILASGISRIEELTGMRCLGVLPYADLKFPEEDSLSDTCGKLEGNDIHKAYLDNLDRLLDDAVDSGFDFDLLEKMAD